MANTAHSSKHATNDLPSDQQLIVEERIVKVGGETTVRKYSKGRFLGKGGFARCYEFQNLETKRIVAAKIIPKATLTKNRAKQKLMSEIRIHRSLHHPGVVSFEHFFEDSENVYILLEMCQNQTLNELLRRRKRLTELEVQCYIMQIITALKYLHSHRVIHRDLKLGNLFLTDKMEEKIGDFGLATKLEFEGDRKRTICGTPNYIAPEILEGKQGHSYEVDIWSLGVVMYTLLIGKPPFETSDVKSTYKRIRINAYSFPDNVAISEHSKNLISRIFNLDPSKRPGLDEMLAHPFFHTGSAIPKLLPASTLACPPSATYVRQYMPTSLPGGSVTDSKPRLESTTPLQSMGADLKSLKAKVPPPSSALMVTDKVSGKLAGESTKTKPSGEDKKETSASRTGGEKKSPTGPSIWVKKWVDYTSKYGLGYLLTSGATGVFFNDSTKIILDPHGKLFSYIERRQSDKQDVAAEHPLTDYPKELQKKVTLLQHFRSYLDEDPANKVKSEVADPSTVTAAPVGPASPVPQKKDGAAVYVKKWMRTKHAIMFRLSNKLVQVNFEDHTEIILSSENREVTYVNKKGVRATYPLTTALESTNVEMAKRLKYTKDILTHMLSASQPRKPGEAKTGGGNPK